MFGVDEILDGLGRAEVGVDGFGAGFVEGCVGFAEGDVV